MILVFLENSQNFILSFFLGDSQRWRQVVGYGLGQADTLSVKNRERGASYEIGHIGRQ